MPPRFHHSNDKPIDMKKILPTLACLSSLAMLTACTTMQSNTIREVSDSNVKQCRPLGEVHGSDAVFVGLSASVGSRNAKARAMNDAVRLQATDVVWSQRGTSMTNEWVGKAYACK